ncbi:MAG: hypothetical protein ACI83B_003480 [Sediminicola sp.]|jgi:hypothetical protein
MKQPLKVYIAILNEAITFKNFLFKEHFEEIKCIAYCEDSDKLLQSQPAIQCISPNKITFNRIK